MAILPLRIRKAEEGDVPLILGLIKSLAEYEKLSNQVVATESQLRRHLFGPRRYAEALLAEWHEEPAGMALFFHSFSTFAGEPGLYLEDLFVVPELRRNGIGRGLLAFLAQIALDRGCVRMEWPVLNWNEPAIEFYRRLGAKPLQEWTTFRVTDQALEDLATKRP